MKKNLVPTALLLTLGSLATAQGNTPASWTNAQLAPATYYVKDAVVKGNTSLVNAEQMQTILSAMKRDTQGALKRRYPQATITTDANTPGAISVQPTLNAPANLLPWSKLSVQYDLNLPDGQVTLLDSFSVMELYSHRQEAMNYAADRLTAKLP